MFEPCAGFLECRNRLTHASPAQNRPTDLHSSRFRIPDRASKTLTRRPCFTRFIRSNTERRVTAKVWGWAWPFPVPLLKLIEARSGLKITLPAARYFSFYCPARVNSPWPKRHDGRISKLDESCTSNPRSEIANCTKAWCMPVQFEILDFGFEVQDSSNFTLPPRCASQRLLM